MSTLSSLTLFRSKTVQAFTLLVPLPITLVLPQSRNAPRSFKASSTTLKTLRHGLIVQAFLPNQYIWNTGRRRHDRDRAIQAMFSILTTAPFLTATYASQVLWHSAAFVYFGLWPAHTMLVGAMTTTTTPRNRSPPDFSGFRSIPAGGDDWHHDLLRYLGFINSAFALLAGLRLFGVPSTGTGGPAGDAALDVLALAVLGWANGSQAFLDLTWIRRSGRWKINGFDVISVLDTLFTVLDLSSVLALLTAGEV